MSGDSLDEILNPELKQAYEADKKNWLSTDKFSKRTPGLFKPEFVSTRSVWLTAKCYLVQNKAGQNKYSCNGVSKKHNDLHIQPYKDVLGVFLKTKRDGELKDIDRAKNVGLRVYDQGIMTHEQIKLGLSAYYIYWAIHPKRLWKSSRKLSIFCAAVLNIFFLCAAASENISCFLRNVRLLLEDIKKMCSCFWKIFFVFKKMCGHFWEYFIVFKESAVASEKKLRKKCATASERYFLFLRKCVATSENIS